MSSRGGTQGQRGRGGGPRGGGPRGGGSRGGGPPRGGDGASFPFRPRGGQAGGAGGGHASSSAPAVPAGPAPPPDARVAAAEDAIVAAQSKVKIDATATFPPRPGYGSKGAPVVLWANYVKLDVPPQLVLHCYAVSVAPAATGRKLVQIVRLAVDEAPALAAVRGHVFTDYKATLVARTRLPRDETDVVVAYRADVLEDADAAEGDRPRPQYTVRLRHTHALEADQMRDFLASTAATPAAAAAGATYDGSLPLIHALNIVRGHGAKASATLVALGADKTFALVGAGVRSAPLGAGLAAMRGFFASVRLATARLLVNVNVSHAAFYQPGPLDDLIRSVAPSRSPHSLRTVDAFLRRVRVQTTHLPPRTNKRGDVIPRVKTVLGLATRNDGHALDHPPLVAAYGAGPQDVEFWLEERTPAPAPATKGKGTAPAAATKGKGTAPAPAAPKKRGKGAAGPANAPPAGGGGGGGGGRYISVYDFFVATYNIHIDNPALPVLNVGTRDNPVYLPAQVCRVLPGQPANAQLSPDQTAAMIKFAVRRPGDNMASIVADGLRTAGLGADGALARLGMAAGTGLITVPGRVLASPRILYGQTKTTTAPAANGSWNMVPRGAPPHKFTRAAALQRWAWLYVDMGGRYPRAATFTQDSLPQVAGAMARVLQECGMAVAAARCERLQLPGADADADDAALAGVFARMAATAAQLVVVVLPATPVPLYNRIKQLGDVRHGVQTVCVVGSKLAKPQGQDQYLRNVALKINLKMGGHNQAVDGASLGLVAEGRTMVVGIDVTHPSPGSAAHAPSVAAMVASVSGDAAQLGQWPGVLSVQARARQEMVSELGAMLESRLRLWRGKALPDNILVYRDGVSEGQYQLVVADELPQLRAACRRRYPADAQKRGLPRITLVVVGKRHHTRFYPDATRLDADADRSANTKAGTVVDRGVTDARAWDFFLQAHAALQGTVRPGHYVVLLDEIFRAAAAHSAADRLQAVTQALCYVFGRATKAVSLCAPAYYADILCERARCYLSSVFDESSSVGGGSVSANAAASHQDQIQIHERLKNSMFYI